MLADLITVDHVEKYKRLLSIGKKCKVVVRTAEGKGCGMRTYIEKIIVTKKYPHFVMDERGRAWQYIDLIMGERT